MKQSKFGSMIAAASLAAAAGLAAAQQPAAPSYKVGFVDTERVMRDSRIAQQAQKRLEDEFQKRDKELASLPPGEIERRRSALVEDMTLRRDEALKQIVEKANTVIKRVAEAEKYDIVFLEAAYVSTRIDITDKVIKALDAAP